MKKCSCPPSQSLYFSIHWPLPELLLPFSTSYQQGGTDYSFIYFNYCYQPTTNSRKNILCERSCFLHECVVIHKFVACPL
jgi:hypothetical protein